MTNRLIARQRECEELQSCMDSNESEFVIVCGRRRIGKTFLVEQFFEGKYDFKFVGGHNLRTRDQLNNFAKALKAYSGTKPAPFKDWVDAFDALEDYLSTLPDDRRKVIFIDEMPFRFCECPGIFLERLGKQPVQYRTGRHWLGHLMDDGQADKEPGRAAQQNQAQDIPEAIFLEGNGGIPSKPFSPLGQIPDIAGVHAYRRGPFLSQNA